MKKVSMVTLFLFSGVAYSADSSFLRSESTENPETPGQIEEFSYSKLLEQEFNTRRGDINKSQDDDRQVSAKKVPNTADECKADIKDFCSAERKRRDDCLKFMARNSSMEYMAYIGEDAFKPHCYYECLAVIKCEERYVNEK